MFVYDDLKLSKNGSFAFEVSKFTWLKLSLSRNILPEWKLKNKLFLSAQIFVRIDNFYCAIVASTRREGIPAFDGDVSNSKISSIFSIKTNILYSIKSIANLA